MANNPYVPQLPSLMPKMPPIMPKVPTKPPKKGQKLLAAMMALKPKKGPIGMMPPMA